MRKYLFLLAMFSTCVLAQTYQDEMKAASADYQEWRKKNTPLLQARLPLNVKDASIQQLSDSSKANKQEKNEIEIYMKRRREYTELVNQITMKYVKPTTYASALTANRNEMNRQWDVAQADLYAGKITFGEYIRKRQEQVTAFASANVETNRQFNIGTALPQAPAPVQQVQQSTPPPMPVQQQPQRAQRSPQQQQMCDNLAQKIKDNDPSQNGWLAFTNGLTAANAQAGNYGNGGVAMANQNKLQQEQLVMQLNDQYMRYCQ